MGDLGSTRLLVVRLARQAPLTRLGDVVLCIRDLALCSHVVTTSTRWLQGSHVLDADALRGSVLGALHPYHVRAGV